MSGSRIYERAGFACGRCGRFNEQPWQFVAFPDGFFGDVDQPCECGENCWLPVTLQGPPRQGQYRAPCDPSEPFWVERRLG